MSAANDDLDNLHHALNPFAQPAAQRGPEAFPGDNVSFRDVHRDVSSKDDEESPSSHFTAAPDQPNEETKVRSGLDAGAVLSEKINPDAKVNDTQVMDPKQAPMLSLKDLSPPERFENRVSDLVVFRDSDGSGSSSDAPLPSKSQAAKESAEITEGFLTSGASEKNRVISAGVRCVGGLAGKGHTKLLRCCQHQCPARAGKGDSEAESSVESDEETHLVPVGAPSRPIELMKGSDSPYTFTRKTRSPVGKCTISLEQYVGRTGVMQLYVGHCAEIIQKLYHGYKVRKRYGRRLAKRQGYREKRKALLIGWKTRRIWACGRIAAEKDYVRRVRENASASASGSGALLGKAVGELTNLIRILYVTGRWILTCTYRKKVPSLYCTSDPA